MNKAQLASIVTAILVCLLQQGCTKDAFDRKSDIRIQTPESIGDYQKLLDGLSQTIFTSHRRIGDYLSDDTYITDAAYIQANMSGPVVQQLAKWDSHMFSNIQSLPEWDDPYSIILTTNVVLEGIQKLSISNTDLAAYNQVLGSAYFLRSFSFLNLADLWGQPYKPGSAGTDLGIILKLSSNLNEHLVRSTVAQTYDQIIKDAKQAAVHLINTSTGSSPSSKVRPSKAAAYALLARAYLGMQDYKNVKLFSDSALNLQHSLLDFNNIDTPAVFQPFNQEVIFLAGENNMGTGEDGHFSLSEKLRNTYDDDDRRKIIYFSNSSSADQNYFFRGDYSGNYKFNGIATDEVYLMRAEANARLNNVSAAIDDINTLLQQRFNTGSFIPYASTASPDDALTIVLSERRKELLMRGARWADLRRLNQDPRFATTVTRTISGITCTLAPNDKRYALPIPSYVLSYNPDIQQNP